MKHLLHIFITIVCIAAVAGCADNSRLRDDIDRAGRLADTHPDSAIALLDSLSPAIEQADKATRMRYDLMLIKSRDKAYIEHRNDSMIAPVVEYFTDHTDPDLTPLALYYAGRVYSDLGDAPRALDYYQQAVNAIGDDTLKNYKTYKVCNSQMAELFMYQRLYHYALEATVRAVDWNDESIIPFDYMAIGEAYSYLKERDSAFIFYDKAYNLALKQNDHNIISRIIRQIAWDYYNMGDTHKADSVLNLLHDTDHIINYKNQFYVILSKVSIDKGDYKSSLPYLEWLSDSGNVYDKGYAKAALANYYKQMPGGYDESIRYFSQYIELLDSATNLEQINAIALAQGNYNYSLREKDNHKLQQENSKKSLYIVILIGILLILALTTLFIVRDIQRKRLDLKCRNFTLQSIIEATQKNSKEHSDRLQAKIDELEGLLTQIDASKSSAILMKLKKSKILLSEAKSNAEERAENQFKLMNSPIVIAIHDKLRHDKRLPSSSPEWDELSRTIEEYNPEFVNKLANICRLSEREMHVSLLLKIEFLPGEISAILGLSPSAVSSIRTRLMTKVFSGHENAPKNWDEFIRML